MMTAKGIFSTLNNQRGISAVLVAVCLVMLVGLVALSIDVSHLVVARNELQNAADAGALAGAAELYTDDGQSVNTSANEVGHDAATANFSEQFPVEVNWTAGNEGDVQRGHWSFGLGSLQRGFTPNDSTAPVALWGVSTEELDENPNFINAVRVRTRRENTPIASWFARIFGYESFDGFAEAVAYIGFAGNLKEATANAPIAICKQAILKHDAAKVPPWYYQCNEGRFINDAAGKTDEETGLWTSLRQEVSETGEDLCSSGTNASEVKPLVDCAAILGGNGVDHQSLQLGVNMMVNNGQIDSAFNAFYNCWENNFKGGYMHMTLPVVDCEDDPTTCAKLVGAVVVTVVHITQQPNYKDLPGEINSDSQNPLDPSSDLDWDPTDYEGECSGAENPDECMWNKFATHYNLLQANPDSVTDSSVAQYHAKSIYFLPDCDPHVPIGITGGENFGILAEIPVLVR
ncbi:MAG: TadG family pilus assembly protein [Desulfobacterales bacterium]|jgi:hypothetical protein